MCPSELTVKDFEGQDTERPHVHGGLKRDVTGMSHQSFSHFRRIIWIITLVRYAKLLCTPSVPQTHQFPTEVVRKPDNVRGMQMSMNNAVTVKISKRFKNLRTDDDAANVCSPKAVLPDREAFSVP